MQTKNKEIHGEQMNFVSNDTSAKLIMIMQDELSKTEIYHELLNKNQHLGKCIRMIMKNI